MSVLRNLRLQRLDLMVRPTRSRVVTKTDIVGARPGRNLIKRKSPDAQFVGIFGSAISEAKSR
jgi:hypothetical protein